MSSPQRPERSHHREFAIGLSRAVGGAIVFALPMFMTLEMWELGVTMPPLRLAGLLLAFLPMLVITSYFAGFEPTFELRDDAVDAMVAFAVGVVTATASLFALCALGANATVEQSVGQICLQAVPASIGALVAQSTLGGRGELRKRRRAGVGGDVFLAALGALYLCLNVAPTDEIVLIAARATPWHLLALCAASIAILEAFAHRLDFRGQRPTHPRATGLGLFVRRTLVGYVVALAVSGGVLWAFGRFAGEAPILIIAQTLVLGLPAALGAASARLIL
jgi:putative integral membrane protein (TIGR02587 family)